MKYFLGIVLLFSFSINATTIHVGKKHPIKSVKTGIALAKDGDTLMVHGGWYKEGNIVIDKKMFPFKKEEMINAVTSYKLSVLGKMVDAIQLVFVDFEKQGGEYQTMVQEMRVALADKFNKLEDQIVKAGGIIKPVDDNENEIKF